MRSFSKIYHFLTSYGWTLEYWYGILRKLMFCTSCFCGSIWCFSFRLLFLKNLLLGFSIEFCYQKCDNHLTWQFSHIKGCTVRSLDFKQSWLKLLISFNYSGFELVKQNRSAKISEGDKEKGPEQVKVFFWSTNHFMKNAKSFKLLQTNLVKFCKFNSLSFFV